MVDLNEVYQRDDWEKKKYVPRIDIENGDKQIKNKLIIGKEIPHPNIINHHNQCIGCYSKPDGEKFAVKVGRVELATYGTSDKVTDTNNLLIKPTVSLMLSTEKSEPLVVTSYCKIHRLWQNSVKVKL
ncbi:MAG: desulfoferrodoxin family protein [Promethearchaeota archaeon]